MINQINMSEFVKLSVLAAKYQYSRESIRRIARDHNVRQLGGGKRGGVPLRIHADQFDQAMIGHLNGAKSE